MSSSKKSKLIIDFIMRLYKNLVIQCIYHAYMCMHQIYENNEDD
jgi:hypothetical protein